MSVTYNMMKQYIPVATKLKSRDNGDFLIVLSVTGEVYYLNETAKFIYGLFDGKNTIEDIFLRLKKEYGASGEEDTIIEHDIVDVIRDFQWQKIIKLMEV